MRFAVNKVETIHTVFAKKLTNRLARCLLAFSLVLLWCSTGRINVEGAAPAEQASSSRSRTATKESPYENSLGMKFVPVPGTRVLFSIWDTRVKDYRAYVTMKGLRQQEGICVWDGLDWALDPKANWKKPGFSQDEQHPVVGVSWEEATAFCKWITAKERAEGKIGRNQEYRLPTDAEWSAAVGSGKYPWGSKWPPEKGAGNYDPSMRVDAYANTSPCGKFSPNEFGLYDMGGNVWQWCEDWYRSSLNESGLLGICPELKNDGGGRKYRVVRGGSWSSGDRDYILGAYRGKDYPRIRCSDYGFRCVLATSRQTNGS